MLRILCVDDHAIVRRGIILILEESTDIDATCDEASNAQEALVKMSACRYDMVLLDISLHGVSGLDLLKQFNREHPGLPVLILSMYPEEQYAIRALSLGAVGYLTKDSAPDELAIAVRKVLSGGRYISSSLAENMAVYLGSGRQTGALAHETLSGRELQIFRLIGSGKSTTQIADELCISVKTVSTYRTRLLNKMNMKNNAELISYAIKHGLLD
jgi:DNA-binding NarL/FixJ family response regulator